MVTISVCHRQKTSPNRSVRKAPDEKHDIDFTRSHIQIMAILNMVLFKAIHRWLEVQVKKFFQSKSWSSKSFRRQSEKFEMLQMEISK